jgi:D-xylose transport system ATP-binding protein
MSTPTAVTTPVLGVTGATKTFGAVVALDGVDMEVHAGEVLALLGDNGAGKSTLIKCISGVHKLDRGEVRIDGVPVQITSAADARESGIETVYQDLALFDNLNPTANFFAGREIAGPSWLPRGLQWLDQRGMNQRTRELLDRLQVRLSPARSRSPRSSSSSTSRRRPLGSGSPLRSSSWSSGSGTTESP